MCHKSAAGPYSIEIRRPLKNRIQNERRSVKSVARLTLRRYVSQVCRLTAFPLKFEVSKKQHTRNARRSEKYVARLTLSWYVSKFCCATAFPLKSEDSHKKSNSKCKENRKVLRAAHLESVCVTGLPREGIFIEISRFPKNRIQHARRIEKSVARLTLSRYVSQVCRATAFSLKFQDSQKIEFKPQGESKSPSRGSP